MAIMAVRRVALGRSDCDRIAFRPILQCSPCAPSPIGAPVRSTLLPGNSLVPSRLKSGRSAVKASFVVIVRGPELDFCLGPFSEHLIPVLPHQLIESVQELAFSYRFLP